LTFLAPHSISLLPDKKNPAVGRKSPSLLVIIEPQVLSEKNCEKGKNIDGPSAVQTLWMLF